jgi:SET family sugar efflux transporter-like MFS transporter
VRPLGPLLLGVLLLGLAEAIAGPYLVLFAADGVGASPLMIGVFASGMSASGILVSTWLGRQYDRRPSRWPTILAAACPTLGYALLPAVHAYPVLLVVGIALLGPGYAGFPQVFAMARDYLAGSGTLSGGRANAVLRSVWSAAWALGPLLGAATLSRGGFGWLFSLSAACSVLVAGSVLLLGGGPSTLRREDLHATARPRNARLVPAAISFGLFHAAMFCGSIVLPLFVTRTLGFAEADVGLLFSICAVVEIPAALALLLLPPDAPLERWIGFGMALFVAYFWVMGVTADHTLLMAVQAARGVSIAVVGALGIKYFQELSPGAGGSATALFSNTAMGGALVAGLIAGVLAEVFGFQVALLACGGLMGLALVVLVMATRTGWRPDRVPTGTTLHSNRHTAA